MANIVVTGATGFIGPVVCRALLAEGHTVAGVTRRPDRLPNGVTPRPVRDIGPETDWLDPLFGAEVVVHCAARVPGARESREQARKEARNEFIRAVDARSLLNKKEIAEVVDLHRSTVSRIASGEVTAGG